ncbi:response regulator [Halorarius litoreus]|uniref:response regulator n=1 Tax=Halorarius litoreus TaxID=2962676 RepID=UPI0020CF32F3|nr:response regulator [Halorarius litoreus]
MTEQRSTADPGETVRVLYVEDNQQTGPLVREWLERHDPRFEVSLAWSLKDATETLAETTFDAVVADYRFPQGSGLDLLPAIRDRDPDHPFLLYSGRVDEQVAEEAREAGVTAVIEKGDAGQLTKLAERILTSVAKRPSTADAGDDGDEAPDRVEAFADEVVHELRGELSVAYGHLDLLDDSGEHAERLGDALEALEATVDSLPERAATFREREGD